MLDSKMPNPLNALLEFQQAVIDGMHVEPCEFDRDYKFTYDEFNGGPRFCYAKIIEGEVQALSTFGKADPINGIPCFSVNYAVKKNHQGRGLGAEAVKKGIAELIDGFSCSPMKSFYIEAIVEETNIPSLKVAKKLFPDNGMKMNDFYTGTACLHFKKLFILQQD